MKLNILPPTLREKQRYIVVRIIADDHVSYESFKKTVNAMCTQLLGEVTTATMRLWIIKNLYDGTKGKAVIKVRKGYVEMVRFCLSMIRHIHNQPITIAVEGVTGTVKSAQQKYDVAQRTS